LWWYLYHTSNKKLDNLKESLASLEFNNEHIGSIELLELILVSLKNLVTLTESDEDFIDYYVSIRELSLRLSEIRRDYTLKANKGALLLE
jgi:hypothetical protein